MILNLRAQRVLIATYFILLAVVYAVVWLLPGVGLAQQDGLHLVTAKAIAAGHGYTVDSLPTPVPQTEYPPFFPALLALFTLVSSQTQWLKLLPLASTAGWLLLTHRLLRRMGASANSASLLVGVTAASPTVVFLGANLMPESLFGFLAAATLLALLDERALPAGVLAGLATLTQATGWALIAACILTFVSRRRLRAATVFTLVASAMVAPWFGWSLAHVTRGAYAAHGSYMASIGAGLALSEKLVVLGVNFVSLAGSLFSLLTGFTNTASVVATVAMLLWCLFVRRQLLPDLFVLLYCLILLVRLSPPTISVAPILPLVLWIFWRVFRLAPSKEALAAVVLIGVMVPPCLDVVRLKPALAAGYFAPSAEPPDNWREIVRLADFIRANSSPESVLLANLDSVFYLRTGRGTVRGFTPKSFDLYYSPRLLAATPDRLSAAISENRPRYLVLTPDTGLPESASFHRSVEALERGGIVEPVEVPGAARDYRLFRIVSP